MREFKIGDYLVQVDPSERMVTAVWEDGKEILDTLPDSKVFDLMGLAEQQARETYEDDLAESRFDDECYHGC
jgi:hypothetical protein